MKGRGGRPPWLAWQPRDLCQRRRPPAPQALALVDVTSSGSFPCRVPKATPPRVGWSALRSRRGLGGRRCEMRAQPLLIPHPWGEGAPAGTLSWDHCRLLPASRPCALLIRLWVGAGARGLLDYTWSPAERGGRRLDETQSRERGGNLAPKITQPLSQTISSAASTEATGRGPRLLRAAHGGFVGVGVGL